jgi:hypothetical protein
MNMLGPPTRLDFIRFGGHGHHGHPLMLQPRAQLLILHRRRMTQINNMDDGSQCVALLQIRFDHWLPTGLDLPWHFSIPISRQIHEKKAPIDEKKVDPLRFPGCPTGLG